MQANNSEMQMRGYRAKDLLENKLLDEALTAIETEVIAQWEQCPARDNEAKEMLWKLYKTSKKFRGLLIGYIEGGKLATKLIEQEKGLLSRIKDRI